jgi:hypothetical protein
MVKMLLLLHEQCEPIDEFMAIMRYVNCEIENYRGTEAFGQGYLYSDIIDNHHYVLEHMLYPLMEECNPNQLYVRDCKTHIEVSMT